MKFKVWTCLQKEDFWSKPFCPHFHPCYLAAKDFQPLQSTGGRPEVRVREKSKHFFCSLFLPPVVSLSSVYNASMTPWYSPTLYNSFPLSQTSPSAERLALKGWPSLPDSRNSIFPASHGSYFLPVLIPGIPPLGSHFYDHLCNQLTVSNSFLLKYIQWL